jgi:hypothetical protein
MNIERRGSNAFSLGVSAVELSSLVAAVRLAADVLSEDSGTPPEAVERLAALLADYERAVSRLERPDGR